ncbi:hypothetical protein NBRC13296_12410 [Paenibacillus chitinolyticus]|uniref:hypothetical protein n=1 Tax=Paenibacillus chitinolyticus TaxID=79263 RepID=UPI00355810CC
MNYINCIYLHSAKETWTGRLVWDSTQENQERKDLGYIRGDISGEIKTQYFEDSISIVIDMLVNQAKSLGIQEHSTMLPSVLYETNIDVLKDFPSNDHLLKEIELERAPRMVVNKTEILCF